MPADRTGRRNGGELAFLVELTFLAGREKLAGHDIFSLVSY